MSETEENDKLPLLRQKPVRINYTKRYDQVSWHSADTDFEPDPSASSADERYRNNKKPAYSTKRKRKIAALFIVVFIFLSVMCGLIYVYVQRGDEYVEITCGKISGSKETINYQGVEKEVYVYKGVPYAQPPINNLRWKAPVALRKGSCGKGIFEAKTFSEPCAGGINKTKTGSEDCLYLTVYTPVYPKTEENLQVIVYFESELSSQAKDEERSYAPSSLFSVDMNAVIVSVNYRIDAFGFLSLNAMNNTTHLYGNFGINDQILALSWVQENIKEFGGNINSVTLLGRTSIYALLASPLAKEKFHKAFVISGSTNFNATFEMASIDNHRYLSSNSKCGSLEASELLKCLYDLSTEEVLETFYRNDGGRWDFPEHKSPNSNYYLIVQEPTTLPISPKFLSQLNTTTQISVLIGNTAQEVGLKSDFHPNTWGELENELLARLKDFSPGFVTKILQDYYSNRTEEGKYLSPNHLYETITSDMRIICPTNLLKKEMEKSSNHIFYRYIFKSANDKTSSHGSDIVALFTMSESPLYKAGKMLRKNLKHFLEFGHPSQFGWDTDKTVVFTDESVDIINGEYHKRQCDLWNAQKNSFSEYAWRN